MIEEIFSRHSRVSLMYSGGKDSLACLLLLQPYWDRTDVVWVNTGNQFPEVIAHMERVKALVPHFTELKSDTSSYWKVHGFPVDVVPTRHTNMGQFIYGQTPLRVCSRFDCCSCNLWKPMEDYFRLVQPSCVIRGDRGSERVEGPKRFGSMEFEFPIFDWTTEQVMNFIRNEPFGLYQDRHELPEGSSLDCMTCMAYNVEHKARMEYLKTHHPGLYSQAKGFFKIYKAAVAEEMKELGE